LLPHISKILQAEFVGIISAYRRAVKALCLLRKQCYLMCSATRHDRSVTDTRFAFFTRDQLYGHSLFETTIRMLSLKLASVIHHFHQAIACDFQE